MPYRRARVPGAGTLACLLACLGGAAMNAAAAEVMLPRTVGRTTTLVDKGKSEAVIVYPSIAQGRALGAAVQNAVAESTGVMVTLAADTELVDQIAAWPAEPYRQRPLIVIGNINNNRAMIPLYGNLLAAADADYPGGDGYTVRTAVDPYGAGVNEIVLGPDQA